jgi:hypothetical protein
MRKLLFAGAAVLLVGAGLFGLKSPKRDKPAASYGGPSITLLGTTNVSGKATVANFHITNRNQEFLVCVPEGYEFLENATWTNEPLVGKAIWDATKQWKGFQTELKPGAAFTFSIPAPKRNVPWRAVIRFQERAAIRDAVADSISTVTATNNAQKNTQQFSGKRFSIKTPAVSE